MPISRKRSVRRRSSVQEQPVSTWNRLRSMQERYPATMLSLLIALVSLPMALVAARVGASTLRHLALNPRLVSPSPNAIQSHRLALRGELAGEPRRVDFVIDGDPVRVVTAQPVHDGVWEGSWDTTDVQNGDHTIALRAEDDESSVMTGAVHVNIQNQRPSFEVRVGSPQPYDVIGTDELSMRATVPQGADRLDFLVSHVYVDKNGHRDVSPIRTISATPDDRAFQHWSATTDPMTVVPHPSGLFQVQAIAIKRGFADSMTAGIPMVLTGTSTSVSFAGVPQGDDEVNFLDIDVSTPAHGSTVNGLVPITASGTPIDAVIAMKIVVWDGNGYVAELPAQNVAGTWTASWDATRLAPGWYWIQSQAYGPAFVPSLSEPILVRVASH